ncbi:MAG: hypothetical protein MUP14_05820 [Dehalococcoidia bacterium]|nr:hypothetical protein [Dehalococcoidia bacterium]
MKEDAARERLGQLIEVGDRLHATARSSEWAADKYIPDKRALQGWAASSRNLIANTVGRESEYYSAFADAIGTCSWAAELERCVGILESLREDWDAGLLVSRDLLITADAFENFLEQADYLLEQGFRDPAAMLAGAVLESTLRKMCEVRSIPTDRQDKIGTLNDKLAKHHKPPAYSGMYHKQIIAWADLRNNAAHGRYSEYTKKQVADMLGWVREFAARHLA